MMCLGAVLQVPAMSHGLPAEVQNLKTVPSPAITAADYLDREMRRVTRRSGRYSTWTTLLNSVDRINDALPYPPYA